MAAAKSLPLLIASILSLIQSVIWIALSVAAILVYLCVIDIDPYENTSDFFRVTLIKLYFEGRQCTLDGSYLGQFNSDYKDPEKISLLTSDVIFAVMAAFVILHTFQFFLSISLYRSNKRENEKNFLRYVLEWSIVTIAISVLDAFLSAEFIWDMFKLIDYQTEDNSSVTEEGDIKGIEYIPLILGLVSSRLVVLWLWNVCMAALYFLCGTCCQKVLGVKKEENVTPPPRPPRIPSHYDTEKFPIYTIPSSHQPSDTNKVVGRLPPARGEQGQGRSVDGKDVAWNPVKSKSIYLSDYGPEEREQGEKDKIQVGMVNECFVSDEPVFLKDDKDEDFAHRPENYVQGQKKVKIQKRPPGKFVQPPVPPQESESDSHNC